MVVLKPALTFQGCIFSSLQLEEGQVPLGGTPSAIIALATAAERSEHTCLGRARGVQGKAGV